MSALAGLVLLQAVTLCPPGNLARGKPISGSDVRGTVSVVNDGASTMEGGWWESPASVVLQGPSASVTIDLGESYPLAALVLQSDNDDSYHVEGSLDGAIFGEVWAVPPYTRGQGLRTRFQKLTSPQTVRYLRVSASRGDGFFAVSELQAYCQLPTPWPPLIKEPPKPHGWAAIDNDVMVAIKGVTAGLGALVLLLSWWARRRIKATEGEERGRWRYLLRLSDYGLGGLGLFALACWWNLGHFHFERLLHIHEHYHYYVGSKYFRELGYTRLYECSTVADLQSGLQGQLAGKKIRNLVTNKLESNAEILEHPERCTSHFSDERWLAFKGDVAFFRWALGAGDWSSAKHDHGYNATPVWGLLGTALSSLAPANQKTMFALGLIDQALLLGMWGCVAWAFGWRTACVALLFWGTNYPARYWWNGGAFLRMDWLVAMIAGVCLLKKERPLAGGFAITYAALLRIFPGFLVAGLVARAVRRMWLARRWGLVPEERRFVAGCLTALLLLVPASCVVSGGGMGGLESWVHFAENSKKHLGTPLTNNMGLRTVLSWDEPARAIHTRNYGLEDPFAGWKSDRLRLFGERRVLFVGLLILFLVLLGRAVEHEPDWVAAAMGVGTIIVATELTCYYYSFMLAAGFLWLRRAWVGIALAASSALSCTIPAIIGWDDDRFVAISLALLVFVFAVPALWSRGGEGGEEPVEEG